MKNIKHFDMVVLGNQPAGRLAAVQAARLGKQVALIEPNSAPGKPELASEAISFRALREAVIQLTGMEQNRQYGGNSAVRSSVSFEDLVYRSRQIQNTENEVARTQLVREGVEIIAGEPRFEDPHTIRVTRPYSYETLAADFVVIAAGSKSARPDSIPFDDFHFIDSDSLLQLDRLPKSILILGGGTVGVEYACVLAALKVKVTLTEASERLLNFADSEVVESLQYQMRSAGVNLLLGEQVAAISLLHDELVQARLQSGKHLRAEVLLYALERQGVTQNMGLEELGIQTDSRNMIEVNAHYQTTLPHIYAVGDVTGGSALASIGMEQGRLAANHAFGERTASQPELFPYDVYTFPEISMVGKTEAELTAAGAPYETGIARYRESTRGQILGDEYGMLKLLIHQQTRQILGVHIIGTGATELIPIGQSIIAFKGGIDYFINSVFSYPTLAECYKAAALDGSEKLGLLGYTPTPLPSSGAPEPVNDPAPLEPTIDVVDTTPVEPVKDSAPGRPIEVGSSVSPKREAIREATEETSRATVKATIVEQVEEVEFLPIADPVSASPIVAPVEVKSIETSAPVEPFKEIRQEAPQVVHEEVQEEVYKEALEKEVAVRNGDIAPVPEPVQYVADQSIDTVPVEPIADSTPAPMLNQQLSGEAAPDLTAAALSQNTKSNTILEVSESANRQPHYIETVETVPAHSAIEAVAPVQASEELSPANSVVEPVHEKPIQVAAPLQNSLPSASKPESSEGLTEIEDKTEPITETVAVEPVVDTAPTKPDKKSSSGRATVLDALSKLPSRLKL